MASFGGEKGVRSGPVLMRREMVMFLPAIALAGLWFGLGAMSLVTATAIAVGWMTRPIAVPQPEALEALRNSASGKGGRADALRTMEALVEKAQFNDQLTACLIAGLDTPDELPRQLAPDEIEQLMTRCAERLAGTVRDVDFVLQIGPGRFAVLLDPTRHLNLESLIQLSTRLQGALETPFSIARQMVTLSAHVGFCQMARAPEISGAGLLRGAEDAAEEALRNGPSAIRAYSREVETSTKARGALAAEVAAALEAGQVKAFFEPQLSTDTGLISGLDLHPVWPHPGRAPLPETELLQAISAARLTARYWEVMLYQCFQALTAWEKAGEALGPVSIRLGPEILRDPRLIEHLEWEMDRFQIDPTALCLVLPEAAFGKLDHDVVARNLRSIANIGCKIELASAATGPSSIAVIRRCGASRLRIERDLVSHVDRDAEQQRLVAACITLAESLGIETLADGARSIGEYAMLSQLGCRHVQGPAISAPMAVSEVIDWARKHREKLEATPQLIHRGSS
ncbi:EAL domain-containing protein [Pseudothioclava arenosa]|uniref:Diguanylate cyclase n=1 Tax=Pseudothioclava arenosa TaxID=1795308 RepID=A0A2A4CNZ7_9RHOB|nr:EAL domain-containing protein [Pseudothioclava arenosa]PCD76008.1 hypothetical protein CLN94_10985 [Pseudothioclava arenosa]